MQQSKHISSIQNPLVKQVLLLKNKSKERRSTGLFVIEGIRELQLALEAGYIIETLCYCEALTPLDRLPKVANSAHVNVISVSLPVYQKMAHRQTTEGVIAICRAKNHTLANLQLQTEKPFILVAEAPEKPGNIGALLRTADAANLDAVLIANPKTDLYNPNIIRSSVGCLFSRKVAMGSSSEILAYLEKQRIKIYCAALGSSMEYTLADFTGATAIVVGTEDVGLSNQWLTEATQNIIIPMEGKIDSLNVSVSAAILIFEGKRQRKKGKNQP